MSMRSSRGYQQGMSLVELMVALLIGVILTSGVISVFITSKASYKMNSGLGQVQEEGRFAMQTLQPVLVMAGNNGCAHVPSTSITHIINMSDEVYSMGDPVYGFEFTGTGTGVSLDDTSPPGASNVPTVDNNTGDWSPDLSAASPSLAAALQNLAVKYSDVLMVHEMLGNAVPILATGSTSRVDYDNTYAYAPVFSAGEVLMASVCSPAEAEVFQAGTLGSGTIAVGGSGGSPGNALTVLQNHYENLTGKAFVAPAQTYVFFVGKGLDKGTSLYEVRLDPDNGNGKAGQLGTPVEIVPGVENMQILYGLDTTGGGVPGQYVTADGVSNWGSVVSVRIALIVHSDANSVDQAPSAATTIHMLGTHTADSLNYKPYPDRRMRRYFVETFSIRNSLQ
jgi:type IV pilus assembly protein PilW